MFEYTLIYRTNRTKAIYKRFHKKLFMKMFSQKKAMGQGIGVLWGIVTLALILVVAGLILAFGADITSDVQADFTVDTYAYNITQDSLDAQNTVAEKQDTLGTIGVAFLIIALLMSVVAGVLAYQRFMQ